MDFLSEYGKHFRLSKMLAKESVKKRLEDVHKRADPDGGMSFLGELSLSPLSGTSVYLSKKKVHN